MPPVCTMWVPVKSVSSEPAIDVFAEAANTVMKPTSATPIISDAAVRAVRFGFRVALRVASSPLSPRSRSGTPSTLATGRASTGPSTATPANVASAPTPTSAISPPRPTSSAATPAAVITEPATARRTEPAERSTLTSRSAAIGAILAARRAGSHADSTVTITPTANERIIAVGVDDGRAVGHVEPEHRHQLPEPGGDADAGGETGRRTRGRRRRRPR